MNLLDKIDKFAISTLKKGKSIIQKQMKEMKELRDIEHKAFIQERKKRAKQKGRMRARNG